MAAPLQRHAGDADLISDLPSELLSAIISRLATDEAARTAVLSTRWRDAWRGTRSASTTSSSPLRPTPPSPASRRRRGHLGQRAPTPSPSRSPPTGAPSRASASPAPPSAPASPPRRPGSATSPPTAAPARSPSSARQSGATSRSLTRSSPPPRSRPSRSASAASPTPGPPPPPRSASRSFPSPGPTSPRLRSRACSPAAPRCAASCSGTSRAPGRIRISSCRSLVLLGVWKYKHLEELTVEDAPHLESLLGDVDLRAAVTIIGAPKLTALGYLVVGFRDFVHRIDTPAAQEKISKGLPAPFSNVKILAISMSFWSKKNIEMVMNLLKCFPFLETLHIQDKQAEDNVDTIDSDYYQKLDPIGCIVNHLKSARLETKVENQRSTAEMRNMFEFVCFLLANAQVLQIMKIQFAISDTPAWIAEHENLAWIAEHENLLSCYRASAEAKVVFEDLKVSQRKGFSIEAVNDLPDPFNGDIDIIGY